MTKRIAVAALASLMAQMAFASSAFAQKKPSGKDAEAHRLDAAARKAAVSGDVAGAVRTLSRALDLCAPANACTVKTKAQLHVSLGSIHGVSEGDYEAAKREFVVALALDPDVRLRTLATPELTRAFEDAQASTKATPAPPPTPTKPPDKQVDVHDLLHPEDSQPSTQPAPAQPQPQQPNKPKPDAKPEPPPAPPLKGRVNWVSIHTMFDFAYLADKNICSPGAPPSYFCTDETGAKYTGHPQPNDEVSNGFAYSTTRVVLGFERVLFPGFTGGVFVGAGFRLGPAASGRKNPSPIHVEARATYTFGDGAYEDDGPRFHPFVFLAGGVEQVDTHVVIRVNEIPCESKVEPACKRDLNAYRVIGSGAATVGGGLRFRIEGRHALRAAGRATLVFGSASGFVVSPELAYEYGI